MSKYIMTFTWHYKSLNTSDNWYIGSPKTETCITKEHPALLWDKWIKDSHKTENSKNKLVLSRDFTVYDSLDFFAEIPDGKYKNIEDMS